ncbi:hypothetical protein VPH35_089556 [Triticum aestivum]
MPPPPLSLFSPAAVPKKAHTGGGSVPEKSCGTALRSWWGAAAGKTNLVRRPSSPSRRDLAASMAKHTYFFFLSLHGARCRRHLSFPPYPPFLSTCCCSSSNLLNSDRLDATHTV